MFTNRFKHKETGNVYEVEKVVNEHGLDIVIYSEYQIVHGTKGRRYARDLYKFLDNMELIKDEK